MKEVVLLEKSSCTEYPSWKSFIDDHHGSGKSIILSVGVEQPLPEQYSPYKLALWCSLWNLRRPKALASSSPTRGGRTNSGRPAGIGAGLLGA